MRVSYDVRASFIFSQLSFEMVLIMSQSIAFVSHICHMVQIAETKLRCVCKCLQRTGDRFATHCYCMVVSCLLINLLFMYASNMSVYHKRFLSSI